MSDAIAIHEAYKRGDLEALKAALGDPPDFPNARGPQGAGEIIFEYAIYHSYSRSSERFSILEPIRTRKQTLTITRLRSRKRRIWGALIPSRPSGSSCRAEGNPWIVPNPHSD